MKRKLVSEQAGISLVEILIVIVIISVLAVFSVTRLGNAKGNFQTRNVARELKINLERARFDSVKRRPSDITNMSRVVISSQTSFSITIDSDQSGKLETADTRTVDLATRGNFKIIANGISLPLTIAFDRKGHIIAVDNSGTAVTPTIIICENCSAATASSAANSYLISVSPTGTITMLNSGETLPKHNNPTIDNVNSNFEVNPLVAFQNGKIPNGTPAPTPNN